MRWRIRRESGGRGALATGGDGPESASAAGFASAGPLEVGCCDGEEGSFERDSVDAAAPGGLGTADEQVGWGGEGEWGSCDEAVNGAVESGVAEGSATDGAGAGTGAAVGCELFPCRLNRSEGEQSCRAKRQNAAHEREWRNTSWR